MKLPATRFMGVQSLGRTSPQALLAAGRSVGAAFDSVLATQRADARREEAKARRLAKEAAARSKAATKANRALRKSTRDKAYKSQTDIAEFELSRFRALNTTTLGAQSTFLKEDLPEGFLSKGDQAGEGDSVPAHQYRAELTLHNDLEAINRFGKGIADSERQEHWRLVAGKAAYEAYAKNKTGERKAGEIYEVEASDARAGVYQQRGDHPAAAAEIRGQDIPPAQTGVKLRENEIDREVYTYQQALRTEDANALEALIYNLQQPEPDSALEPDDQLKFLTQMASKLEKIYADDREREIKDNTKTLSNLEVRMKEDPFSVTAGELDDLYARGVITTAGKLTTLKLRLIDLHLEKEAKTLDRKVLMGQLAAGFGVDGSKEQGEIADEIWLETVAATPEGAEPPLLEFIHRFKHVPESARRMVLAGNNADKPALIAAAQTYSQIHDVAPTALRFSDKRVERVKAVAALIDTGMQPSAAVDQTIRWEQMTEAERDTTAKVAKLAAKDLNGAALQGFANKRFELPGIWNWATFADTPTGAHMTTQFDNLVEEYLPRTGGDLDAAQRMAWSTISPRYQLTDINGDWQLMEYGPGGNTELMRKELETEYGDGVKLTSDLLTRKQVERGEEPTYQVWTVDEETGVVLRRPRWKPDREALQKAEKKRKVDTASHVRKGRERGVEAGEARVEGRQRTREDDRQAATERRRLRKLRREEETMPVRIE